MEFVSMLMYGDSHPIHDRSACFKKSKFGSLICFVVISKSLF